MTPETRFFVDVAAYAHESWFPNIPTAVFTRAQGSTRGRQLLSRWLMRAQALDIPANLSLADTEQWLLAGQAAMDAMALDVATRMIAPNVRSVVFRKDVEKLQAAFGEEMYNRVLESPALTDKRVSGAWIERAQTPRDVREAVQAIGYTLLAAQLPADERQLRARLRLMFPRMLPAHAADEVPAVAAEVRAWLDERTRALQPAPPEADSAAAA
jgi:hypothetical protein